MFASLASGPGAHAVSPATWSISRSWSPAIPVRIFTGPSKLVVYTLLPAGFIVLAPVKMIRTPSTLALVIVVAAAVAYAHSPRALTLGLARYRKGSTPTVGL